MPDELKRLSRQWRGTAMLLMAASAAGCDQGASNGTASGSPPAETPIAVQDAGPERWLGRWIGPEGTSLTLERKDSGGYRVTIESLDGPASYDGKGVGDRVAFNRNGVAETIRASDGPQTGMKWLADKSECLMIKAGEGYCRN